MLTKITIKTENIFINYGHIKLIKSDSKDIYNNYNN